MNMKARKATIAAILVGIATVSAGAFSLEPMTVLLAPSGPGSIATFRVRNDGKERVALRFQVLSRAQSADGKEVNAPADDSFVVYPSRVLVEPGATATAKVQWKGSPNVASEQSFRFVAEQVPIDAVSSRDSGSSIKVMFRYVASLYVGEEAFKPELVVTLRGATGPSGENGYLVRIDNIGKRHVIAAGASVAIEGSTAAPLSAAELGALSDSNYLPGTGRSAFIPRPEALPGESRAARITYEGEY